MPSSPMPAVAASSRDEDIASFISTTPWAGGELIPLRIDASVRRYYRVTHPGQKPAVLMDARPPQEKTDVYEFMSRKFRALGFTVPEIYAADHARGLVLMEDFGDDRFFEDIARAPEKTEKLITLAVDGLIHKALADPAIALDGCVAYSDDYWMFRIEQFLIHYIPSLPNFTLPDGAADEFMTIFRRLITSAHHFPPVLLHGDYGAQNMFYLPEKGDGIAALGLIDFQDLTDARGNMSGSPAFDLVFLLQDVRMKYPAGMEGRLKDRFITGAHISDRAAFEADYAIIGAAQAAKCLGLFARLGGAGRPEYLEFLPNCWRNLRQNMDHPALAELKGWVERHMGG